MARHWITPIQKYIDSGKRVASAWRWGRFRSGSTASSTNPPRISVVHTTRGSNSTPRMKSRPASTPTTARRQEGGSARRTYEAPRLRVVRQRERDRPEPCEVGREYRQDRAELDQDGEGPVGMAVEPEEALEQDQVAGGGDRDELRRAFQQSRNMRLEGLEQVSSVELLSGVGTGKTAEFGGRDPRPRRRACAGAPEFVNRALIFNEGLSMLARLLSVPRDNRRHCNHYPPLCALRAFPAATPPLWPELAAEVRRSVDGTPGMRRRGVSSALDPTGQKCRCREDAPVRSRAPAFSPKHGSRRRPRAANERPTERRLIRPTGPSSQGGVATVEVLVRIVQVLRQTDVPANRLTETGSTSASCRPAARRRGRRTWRSDLRRASERSVGYQPALRPDFRASSPANFLARRRPHTLPDFRPRPAHISCA